MTIAPLPTADTPLRVRLAVEHIPALHQALREQHAVRACARLAEAWRGWTQLDWMTSAVQKGDKWEPIGWPGNEIVELLSPVFVGPIAPRPRAGSTLWDEPLGMPPLLSIEAGSQLRYPPSLDHLHYPPLGPVRGWAFEHHMWADNGESNESWPALRDPVAALLWSQHHYERVMASSIKRRRGSRTDPQAEWARFRDEVAPSAVGFWNVFAQVVADDIEQLEQQTPQTHARRDANPLALGVNQTTRDGLVAVRKGIATPPANRRGASWH